MTLQAVPLKERGLLFLEGEDLWDFLQGIICNDVQQVKNGKVIYAALLTPQGKYLFDFFLIPYEKGVFLECEEHRKPDLIRKLMMYRLRSKVQISDVSGDWHLYALPYSEAPKNKAFPTYSDPRHEKMPMRVLMPSSHTENIEELKPGIYHDIRLTLGIPEGSQDMETEKTLILEANFEPLHGVDFQKGCYVGQEITARMKHRGKVRKRLIPVTIEGAHPDTDTPITSKDHNVGSMKSRMQSKGIAMLRLEDLDKAPFQWGDAKVSPIDVDWLIPYLP